MPRTSAGLLLYRLADSGVEVLLGHPGGPFWARKDAGAWSIPKGEYTDEDPWDAARREFGEEIGLPAPEGPRIDFDPIKQAGGKIVTAFGVRADLDVADAHSNTFELEWPRGSGTFREYPELDRVAWFPLQDARSKILKAQLPLLDQLERSLAAHGPDGSRSR
jgi:predicted NUDIX family NTP pyrophosphohydrolase